MSIAPLSAEVVGLPQLAIPDEVLGAGDDNINFFDLSVSCSLIQSHDDIQSPKSVITHSMNKFLIILFR